MNKEKAFRFCGSLASESVKIGRAISQGNLVMLGVESALSLIDMTADIITLCAERKLTQKLKDAYSEAKQKGEQQKEQRTKQAEIEVENYHRICEHKLRILRHDLKNRESSIREFESERTKQVDLSFEINKRWESILNQTRINLNDTIKLISEILPALQKEENQDRKKIALTEDLLRKTMQQYNDIVRQLC